jgi:acetyl esterase/lipase
MKTFIPLLLITLIGNCALAQQRDIIFLWPGDVPGENTPKKEPVAEPVGKDNILRISEVADPSVEVFLPDGSNRNNAAVVVCPGGGYHILAYNLEGTEVASWLNSNGYTAFVLKYRVPDKKEGALQDVQRALRIVKFNALKWGIDPEKVGVMGFSAGGSLSARASTLSGMKTYQPVDKADSLSCRPAFSMLIYPAYLDLGPDHSLTPELKLGKEVPPIFIFQTADDQYGNSALVMARSMRDSGLPVELHLLPEGGHGYGLRPGNRAAETWPLLAQKWLETILAPHK